MKFLTQIIGILKPVEINQILRLYKAQEQEKDNQKRIKLFKLARENKKITDEEACQILYKTKPNAAFSQLKQRVQRDVLNFSYFLNTNLVYKDQMAREISNIQLATMHGKTLLGRGAYAAGEHIMTKALRHAIKYEMLPEIIAIKEALRISMGYFKGPAAFEEHSKDLDFYVKQYSLMLEVRGAYFKYYLPNRFDTNKQSKLTKTARQEIERIEALVPNDACISVLNAYHQMGAYIYNDILREPHSAIPHATKCVELTNKAVFLSGLANRGGAHLLLAYAYMNAKDYGNAAEQAKEATQVFRTGKPNINELTCMEAHFMALYHQAQYHLAEEILQMAETHAVTLTQKLIQARWKYFKACLRYRQGNLDECHGLLLDNPELMQDRSGWLFGLKLLTMMLEMENKEPNLDLLDYQFGAYNNLLTRQKNNNVVRAREIGKVIRAFLKDGSYPNAAEAAAKALANLREAKGELFWDPKGFELVRFDEWFMDKVSGR